jgi:phage baseplate assembly protein W
MNIDFPFHTDNRGRTGETGDDDHVRDLIEQVLFTTPGERVNRPDFGSGLLQLVFAPLSDELTATTQFLVQGALQQWLGDIIQVGRVEVTVRYLIRRTDQRREETFSREA